MKKIRILHTGDLHLGTPFFSAEGKADILKYELLRCIEKIADVASAEKVDAVVVAGDITDCGMLDKPSYDYLYKILSNSHIPVVMILGNHDVGFDCEIPKNILLLKAGEKVSVGDADIYGAPFDAEKYICGFAAENSDRINIMLLHGTVGGSEDNPVSLSDIASSGLDYLALGHIHKYDGLKKAGNTFYAYCGVPQGRGFDEQGQKGVIVADVEKGGVDARFVPVAKRIYEEIKIDVTDCGSYIDVLNKIGGKNDENLYKFVLTGSPDGYIDFSAVQAVLKDRFFYAKVVDNTKAEVDIMSVCKENTLVGQTVENIISQGGGDNALKYALSALKGERIYVDED